MESLSQFFVSPTKEKWLHTGPWKVLMLSFGTLCLHHTAVALVMKGVWSWEKARTFILRRPSLHGLMAYTTNPIQGVGVPKLVRFGASCVTAYLFYTVGRTRCPSLLTGIPSWQHLLSFNEAFYPSLWSVCSLRYTLDMQPLPFLQAERWCYLCCEVLLEIINVAHMRYVDYGCPAQVPLHLDFAVATARTLPHLARFRFPRFIGALCKSLRLSDADSLMLKHLWQELVVAWFRAEGAEQMEALLARAMPVTASVNKTKMLEESLSLIRMTGFQSLESKNTCLFRLEGVRATHGVPINLRVAAAHEQILLHVWDINKGQLSPATLLEMSRIVVESPALKPEDEDEDCSVCLQSLQHPEGEQRCVAVRPCKHRFHIKCLIDWIAESFTCPMCRGQLESMPRDAAPAVPGREQYSQAERVVLDHLSLVADNVKKDLPPSLPMRPNWVVSRYLLTHNVSYLRAFPQLTDGLGSDGLLSKVRIETFLVPVLHRLLDI